MVWTEDQGVPAQGAEAESGHQLILLESASFLLQKSVITLKTSVITLIPNFKFSDTLIAITYSTTCWCGSLKSHLCSVGGSYGSYDHEENLKS